MSEPNFSKEEYMRAFRQRLYESEAFHQALVMMLAKDRAAQNLQLGYYSRQKSRSMLKRLASHVTTWLHSQRKAKPHVNVDTRLSQDEAPWTIDAFYVVADDGTISETSIQPSRKK